MFGDKLNAITNKLIDIYQRGYGEGYAANGGTIGLSYTLSSDGTYYTCDGIGTATAEDIVIASLYKSTPVTQIASNAFKDNTTIKSVFIPDTITEISQNAFDGCTGLEKLRIGISVKKIYSEAFRNCTSLSGDVTLGKADFLGEGAFRECTSLKGVSIPETLSSIGAYTFYNCASLENVIIEEGVDEIKEYAFYKCTSLKDVRLPESMKYIREQAFNGCSAMRSLYIGWEVADIGQFAFSACAGLEEIYYNAPYLIYSDSNLHRFSGSAKSGNGLKLTIGKSVSSIPNYLFSIDTNSKLKSIEFEEGCKCTEIGDYAFENAKIANITLPYKIEKIGSYAFSGCSTLKSITIPDKVQSIGAYAFDRCSKMESITIGTNVKTIGNNAFVSTSRLRELYFNATNMDDLTSYGIFHNSGTSSDGIKLVIGANVTKIPAYLSYASGSHPNITSIEFEANSQCTSIGNYGFAVTKAESIEIPDTVTSIGDSAFNAAKITSFSIPDSVTNIGTYAFGSCTSLETIKVGNGVSSIGSVAFQKCSALKSVHISDIAKWCGIKFTDANANPLSLAHNLYLNDELVYNLIIPESVTSINSYAFYHCLSIVSVTIPATVTKIGTDVFKNCGKIAEVVNKSTLNSTPKPSIEQHSGETKVTNVDGYLFYTYNGKNYLIGYAGNDEELILPEDYNGERYTINDSAFINDKFTSVIIGSGVQEIKYGAFRYCYSLTSINIPDGITSIASNAFSYCTSLTSITIPDSVTEIMYNAFSYCSSLAKVLLGSGIIRVYSNAFLNCNNLYNIYCKFADGAVSGAPWGAVNATIAYNATIDDYNSEV